MHSYTLQRAAVCSGQNMSVSDDDAFAGFANTAVNERLDEHGSASDSSELDYDSTSSSSSSSSNDARTYAPTTRTIR